MTRIPFRILRTAYQAAVDTARDNSHDPEFGVRDYWPHCVALALEDEALPTIEQALAEGEPPAPPREYPGVCPRCHGGERCPACGSNIPAHRFGCLRDRWYQAPCRACGSTGHAMATDLAWAADRSRR